MKLKECAFLADENIHPELIQYIRDSGIDIVSAGELSLRGKADSFIIDTAFHNNRVIITHDSDFGTLATADQKEFLGILYLRPGHVKADFSIKSFQTVISQNIEVTSGIIIVAYRKDAQVNIRIRRRQR